MTVGAEPINKGLVERPLSGRERSRVEEVSFLRGWFRPPNPLPSSRQEAFRRMQPVAEDSFFDNVTGVILVGGKSRRMGRDKALLELGGETLFERVLGAFRANFRKIILTGNGRERFARYGLPFYDDLYPGSALGGLYTGLYYAETDAVFVSSCDLPFPSSRVIGQLCSLAGNGDAVVPRLSHGYEPLYAAYSKSCLGPVKEMLEAQNYCVFDLYPRISVRDVLEDELESASGGLDAFLNVNTPEEFEAAKRRCI